MSEPVQIPAPPAADRARLVMGADHAGWRLKNVLLAAAQAAGWVVQDVGTSSDDSVDYPDFGLVVGRAVACGEADFGVLVCGTGIGIAMAANRVSGVRAAVVHDDFTAHYSRAHNDANVLCLGARVVGEGVAQAALATFLGTEFLGGRHERRVAKLTTEIGSKA